MNSDKVTELLREILEDLDQLKKYSWSNFLDDKIGGLESKYEEELWNHEKQPKPRRKII